MPYCMSCGQQLPEGAKFCSSCGTPAGETSNNSQRQQEWAGSIIKCPMCGETLKSFESNCPACGYELRRTVATNSVRDLSMKLQQIESERTSKSAALFGRKLASKQSDIDEQKINLIKSFAIPNSKEDILEFAVLAASNVDSNAYDDSYGYLSQHMNARRRNVSDAWMSKLEQAYQKAKIVLADDPRMKEIQTLYDSTHKSVNRAKWRMLRLFGIIYGSFFAVAAVIIIIVFSSIAIAENKEIKRLEDIEENVQIALENGDYKLALMNADTLDFNGGDASLERDWRIKHDYWIDKVIEEAAKDGIILERPVEEDESDEETTVPFDLTKENSIGAMQYEFKYNNFLEVKQELEKRGFTNVQAQGMQDLTTDWLAQDGTVEKVTVDGETGFSADVAFPLDVEIVIYFHSYKE